MKPVDQTGFGRGEGNCFAASVASVIECDDLAELSRQLGVGAIEITETGEHWYDRAVRVLSERGFDVAYIPEGEPAPLGYSLVGGMSPRGLNHSVVALDGVMVHDPHPSRVGVVGPFDYITITKRAP